MKSDSPSRSTAVAVAVEPADLVEDMPPLRHLPNKCVEELDLGAELRVLSAREVDCFRAERRGGTHGCWPRWGESLLARYRSMPQL